MGSDIGRTIQRDGVGLGQVLWTVDASLTMATWCATRFKCVNGQNHEEISSTNYTA